MTGVFEPREPLSAYCVARDAAIRLLAAHQDNKTPLPAFFSFSALRERILRLAPRETKPLITTASVIKLYTRRKIHLFARYPAISFYIIILSKESERDSLKNICDTFAEC